MFNNEAEAMPIGYEEVDKIIAADPISPERIQIPVLSVTSDVVPVGISHKGAIMSPESFKEVGWYKYGVKPGEIGNAFIVGHLDNAFGLSGVFENLNNVVSEDDIYMYDQSGKELHFKVTDKKIIPYDVSSVNSVVSESAIPRIVIITCHGEWLKDEKTYTERLIVTAELQN
jgi:sortase A